MKQKTPRILKLLQMMDMEGSTSSCSGVNSDKQAKKMVRFNCFHDIMLLRAVVSNNPFSVNTQKPWDLIAAELQIYLPGVTPRCCRERAMRLLKMFKEEDRGNLRKSGTEEQYAEKEQLLQELVDLEEERRIIQAEMSQTKKRSAEEEMEVVNKIRTAALTSIEVPSSSDSGSVSGEDVPNRSKNKRVKRRSSMNRAMDLVANYLGKKTQTEVDFRQSQLEFERQRLAFDKERLDREMDVEHRRAQLELDRQRLAFDKERLDRETEIRRLEIAERARERQMMQEILMFAVNQKK